MPADDRRQAVFSLVIPFYNEEENIEQVVGGLVTTFERECVDYELVLVNNGSMDESPRILEDVTKGKPDRIKVVHVPVNQGYGWGIINGLKLASGEFTGYMCGDGQIGPRDVIRVFDTIKNDNYDLVKVKRVVRRDGIIRKVLTTAYNFLFLVLFNVGTLDVNGTPKIARKEALAIIGPEAKDWFIDAEIMLKAKYLNLRVGEVAVEFGRRQRGSSHVGFTTLLEFGKNMLYYKLGKGIKQWKQKALKS